MLLLIAHQLMHILNNTLSGMGEFSEFSNKLRTCDLIVLTSFSKDHSYCRFFQSGQYVDRMHISNPVILNRLNQLSGEGDEIDARGIDKLIRIFVGV